jgi:hypothetical protein
MTFLVMTACSIFIGYLAQKAKNRTGALWCLLTLLVWVFAWCFCWFSIHITDPKIFESPSIMLAIDAVSCMASTILMLLIVLTLPERAKGIGCRQTSNKGASVIKQFSSRTRIIIYSVLFLLTLAIIIIAWYESKDPPAPKRKISDDALQPFYKLVRDSDDYSSYRREFALAARKLVRTRRCKSQDFKDWGGWTKSTQYAGAVYFTYCGGTTVNHKIYLNTSSGKIF